MPASKAFTLRDLVVLIILIVLPLPLVTASIQQARQSASSATCAMNLSNLTRAVNVYAQTNRGFIPPYRNISSYGGAKAAELPYRTYIAFKWDMYNLNDVDPNTGLYSDARNLGIPYSKGFIRPSEMLYCPNQRDQRSTRAYYGYSRLWGSWIPDVSDESGSDFIRTGYMWNPWVKIDYNIGGSYPFSYEDKLQLAKHPKNRPILMDLMTRSQNYAHISGATAAWNLAFADGHVATMSCNITGDPLTPRNICSFFQRLEATGISADYGENPWFLWGCNSESNNFPMGQQLNPNGTVRFELLTAIGG